MKIYFLYNFFLLTFGSFIPNVNKIITKELNNYQNILEMEQIPCFIQSHRIKTFNSAHQKMNKRNLKDIYYLNDLIGFRFVFYHRYDLLKFYHHLYNEKQIIYYQHHIIGFNNTNYSGILLRYQNDFSECPISQIECQMFLIKQYFEFVSNEDKNLIKSKNLGFPYNDL